MLYLIPTYSRVRLARIPRGLGKNSCYPKFVLTEVEVFKSQVVPCTPGEAFVCICYIIRINSIDFELNSNICYHAILNYYISFFHRPLRSGVYWQFICSFLDVRCREKDLGLRR